MKAIVEALSEYILRKQCTSMSKWSKHLSAQSGGWVAAWRSPGPRLAGVWGPVSVPSPASAEPQPHPISCHQTPATPGLYRRLSSCTWQHNTLINLEGPPLAHTLIKHLLLILSILSLSSIPVNQRALSVAVWAIFWRPCIFSYKLLTLQCIGFDNLAGMVSNNVYNSKQ